MPSIPTTPIAALAASPVCGVVVGLIVVGPETIVFAERESDVVAVDCVEVVGLTVVGPETMVFTECESEEVAVL